MKRDAQLVEEAEKVITTYVMDKGPDARVEVMLNTQLELQTILCAEYR